MTSSNIDDVICLLLQKRKLLSHAQPKHTDRATFVKFASVLLHLFLSCVFRNLTDFLDDAQLFLSFCGPRLKFGLPDVCEIHSKLMPWMKRMNFGGRHSYN
ncbi:hypothetical protein CEXT_566991 [Caerostris extrusa]|uniref:Transposase n=1 Tax=Caerostris extrusa TaxID=172846 RepID=A0AAV4WTA6_CAEEX|nr:hypothetical protein CEXT_566991 [Caerostris extrusa]